jgi:hypothetical protein
MKVTIGPYIYRWTSSSVERAWLEYKHKKPYYEVLDDELTKADNLVIDLCDKWQTVLNATINRYLDYKKRKIKIKIHDYDTWNMNHTLAMIVLPMLKQLKATKHGSVEVEYEDVPEHLRPDIDRFKLHVEGKLQYYEIDNTVHDRWEWVLDEMIYAFEIECDEDWEDQFRSGECDWKYEKTDEGKTVELVKGPNHTYTVDREGMKAVIARRDNGIRLFGKYYHGLWD